MKKWWKSKTAIVGIAMVAVGAGSAIYSIVTGNEPLNVETQAEIATAIAGAVMFALRWITREPIGP